MRLTLLFLILLMLGSVNCTNDEVIFESNYLIRFSVKRASGQIVDPASGILDFNSYVHKFSKTWVGKTLYARLVAPEKFDNKQNIPVDCFLNKVSPTMTINEFCTRNANATYKVLDPLNPGLGASRPNIFQEPALYSASVLLGTGESSQSIGLFDFVGVKEGVYDLVAFVDTETRLAVEEGGICTCTRAGGCSPSEYAEFLSRYGTSCTSLQVEPTQVMPSNGDNFYVVDNIVVNEQTKIRLVNLSLLNTSDSALSSTGSGGDGDVWDEWRCLYYRPEFTGFSLHKYIFPPDTVNNLYCRPGTNDCGGNAESGGISQPCGTMMDFGTDYNMPPVVSFSQDNLTYGEINVSIGTATSSEIKIPIQIDYAVASIISVSFSEDSLSTAKYENDYTYSAIPNIIPAGSKNGFIHLKILSDLISEPTEFLKLKLISAGDAAIGVKDVLTLTIKDTSPFVNFSMSTLTMTEGTLSNIPAKLDFILDYMSVEDSIINYVINPTSSAILNNDYIIGLSPVIIPAGSTAASLNLFIKKDALTESIAESLVLDIDTLLNKVTNAVIGPTSNFNLTIKDPPRVWFATASSSILEGTATNNTKDLIVNLDYPASSNISLDFALSLPSTATENVDFVVSTSSPLIINAGQTSGIIKIITIADSFAEADEPLRIDLLTASNAFIGLGTASTHTLTILNDD